MIDYIVNPKKELDSDRVRGEIGKLIAEMNKVGLKIRLRELSHNRNQINLHYEIEDTIIKFTSLVTSDDDLLKFDVEALYLNGRKLYYSKVDIKSLNIFNILEKNYKNECIRYKEFDFTPFYFITISSLGNLSKNTTYREAFNNFLKKTLLLIKEIRVSLGMS